MKYDLIPDGGLPISQRIAELVLKNVELGYLPPGEKLPTERELAKRLGVARGTVKAAYKKLQTANMIETRQGSGSFVVRDEDLSLKIQKKKAAELVSRTVAELRAFGLETGEIRRLVDLCLLRDSRKTLNIALVHDNPEQLADFKKQLSYLPCVFLSIFIMESITEDEHPENILQGFDLIIVPSVHHDRIKDALPGLKGRVVEAAISPHGETMIQVTALPRDSRIGIICRSNAFLGIVKGFLASFGFREDKILSFFEMEYTTDTYFPGGIDVLISFEDAHIFTDPAFLFRNEEFFAKGGKIIAFRYEIQRGTLLLVEDKVSQLLSQKKTPE